MGTVMATVTLVLGWTLGWKSGRKATEKKLLKTAYEQAEKERDLWEDQEEPGCMRTCSGKNLVHEEGTWKNEEEEWYAYFSEKGTKVHISSRCRGLNNATGPVKSRRLCFYCQEVLIKERSKNQSASSTDRVSIDLTEEQGARKRVSKKLPR